jgi:threonylcarbamoyladenosine tRNA methylthiotransferase MtaB
MKLFIKTFGCRVNQIEGQSILEALQKNGYSLADSYENCDVCIVNTCTVTKKADNDVNRLLRLVYRRNPGALVLVCGCLSSTNPDEIKKNHPTAKIIPNKDKKNIFKYLPSFKTATALDWNVSEFQGRTRAFVKIQDGCNEKCNYCIVSTARPIKQSKPLDETVEEMKRLLKNGYQEIVLCGINIGNYLCPDTKSDLADLLKEIFKLNGDFRIRLSSIEVNNITNRLLSVAKSGGARFCDYFHIPLQSGCNKVLSEMNRKYSTINFKRAMDKIRKTFPNVGIFADVIAGYPTEKKKDFKDTYRFIKENRFAGLHVFSFSPRKGTPAYELKQLPVNEIKERSQKLRDLDKKLREDFAKSLVGSTQNVLIEKKDKIAKGLSSNFQKVHFDTDKTEGFVRVLIKSHKADICIGK